MKQGSLLPADESVPMIWAPTRAAADARLDKFLPSAGNAYARERNVDSGAGYRANVSALSPWLRHRLLLEHDVLRATLARHSSSGAEKFIQEVLWRGYFKGWLQHRPQVWQRYKQNLLREFDGLESNASLAQRFSEAVCGNTGIACFDAWVRELIDSGYLHNHTRMWFASIWVHTLKLPWELGADFFYRHLLDGDPASNTCSWRWVCGLHTKGKTYLAQAWNIEKFTNAKFNPSGQLSETANALVEPDLSPPTALTFCEPNLSGLRYGLLITEEDCAVDRLSLAQAPVTLLALASPTDRSILPVSAVVGPFAPALVCEAARLASVHYQLPCSIYDEGDWCWALSNWVGNETLDCVVTPRLATGPVKTRLSRAAANLGVPLYEIDRPYDKAVWPYTKRGFFALKKKIPVILSELDLV